MKKELRNYEIKNRKRIGGDGGGERAGGKKARKLANSNRFIICEPKDKRAGKGRKNGYWKGFGIAGESARSRISLREIIDIREKYARLFSRDFPGRKTQDVQMSLSFSFFFFIRNYRMSDVFEDASDFPEGKKFHERKARRITTMIIMIKS